MQLQHIQIKPLRSNLPFITRHDFRILPSRSLHNRQVSCPQLFLNDLPPTNLLFLMYPRVPLCINRYIRGIDFQLLELRGFGKPFGLFRRLEGIIQVGEGVGFRDDGVGDAIASELHCAFEDLKVAC